MLVVMVMVRSNVVIVMVRSNVVLVMVMVSSNAELGLVQGVRLVTEFCEH